MGRYRKERKSAMRRKENMMRLQTIQSEGSAVHFEHDLSTTGPHACHESTGPYQGAV